MISFRYKDKLIIIMNKKYIVTLTETEIEFLKELISTRSSKSSVVLNAQILLAANANKENLTDTVIAQRYHVKPWSINSFAWSKTRSSKKSTKDRRRCRGTYRTVSL